jgi:hypothetical protein
MQREEVHIRSMPGQPLHVLLEDGWMAVRIVSISENSPACGKLLCNDTLLSVNGIGVRTAEHAGQCDRSTQPPTVEFTRLPPLCLLPQPSC